MNFNVKFSEITTDPLQNEKVLTLLGVQLQKDLCIEDDLFNIEDLRLWVTRLRSILDTMMSKNLERFFATMYRIDIGENVVKQTMVDGKYDLNELTEAVLNRELKKVIIRLAFGKKNSHL